MPDLAPVVSEADSEGNLLASFDRARKLGLLGPPRTARSAAVGTHKAGDKTFEKLLPTANTC